MAVFPSAEEGAPAVFPGNYNNPEANRCAFRDGWFRTGDIGHMDWQGFLYITGRASVMYISGGPINIYPHEMAEKIVSHPHISEVAVVGMPDPAGLSHKARAIEGLPRC